MNAPYLQRPWGRLCAGLFGVASLVVGCGPSATSPPPATPTEHQSRGTNPKSSATPRDELIAAIDSIDDRGSPLGAMPDPMRAALSSLLQRLEASDRDSLLSDDVARQRPLLHLAAGGLSIQAYLALTNGPAGPLELMTLQARLGLAPEEVVTAARRVAQRAAQRLLASVASALRDGSASSATLSAGYIAATALQDVELALSFRRQSHSAEPGDASKRQLVEALARTLRVKEAQALFAELKQSPESAPAEIAHTAELLQAAQVAASPLGRTSKAPQADVLEVGRAWLALGRYDRAREVLEPDGSRAKVHLGLAAAHARAVSNGGICPELPTTVFLPQLCALAWTNSKSTQAALASLDAAWASGEGRDAESVEAYVGMKHVVPWMYGLAAARETGMDDQLASLIADLKTARSVDARFEGLLAFAQALAAARQGGNVAKDPDRVSGLPQELRERLQASALSLLEGSTPHPVSVAAAVGIAGLLSRDQSVQEILSNVPSDLVDSQLLATLGKMQLLMAVAHDDLQLTKQARDSLSRAVQATSPEDPTQSELVLMIAESRVSDTATATDYQLLKQVADRLVQTAPTPALHLRGLVDRACAEFFLGKTQAAVQQLNAELPKFKMLPASSTERSLYVTASGYLQVLSALGGGDAERKAGLTALAELSTAARGGSSPSVIQWLELWQERLRRVGCRPAPGCGRIDKLIDDKKLQASTGVEPARLLQAGFLTVGSLGLSFRYGRDGRVWPNVDFSPTLLPVAHFEKVK